MRRDNDGWGLATSTVALEEPTAAKEKGRCYMHAPKQPPLPCA